MRAFHIAVLVLSILAISQTCVAAEKTPRQLYGSKSIQVLAHRGAPEYVPEHTLGAYALAMRQMVDYIEPDICLTKDGIPICMHDWELSHTTDVASHPEFLDRKKTVILNSGTTTGWFTDDFTLAEIKTLRVKQRLKNRDTFYDGLFQVPTLNETIQFVTKMNKKLGLNIGLYIEPKHPQYFKDRGLIYDDILIQTLLDNGLVIQKTQGAQLSNVIIECFESEQLKTLRPKMDLRFVQLINIPCMHADDTNIPFVDMMNDAGLEAISKYASAIGPVKNYYYPMDKDFMNLTKTCESQPTLVGQANVDTAHKYNLVIHPWTARNHWEDQSVVNLFEGDEVKEYLYLFELGIDGIFSESAGAAICARSTYEASFNVISPEPIHPHHKDSVVGIVIPIIATIVALLIGVAIGRYAIPLPLQTPIENLALLSTNDK